MHACSRGGKSDVVKLFHTVLPIPCAFTLLLQHLKSRVKGSVRVKPRYCVFLALQFLEEIEEVLVKVNRLTDSG